MLFRPDPIKTVGQHFILKTDFDSLTSLSGYYIIF